MSLRLCLFSASLALSAAAAPESVFKFHLPDGWLDLSPGAPEDNFNQVAPEVARIARNGRFAAYGFDIAGATDTFTANENVHVQEAKIQISQAILPQIRSEMQQAASSDGTPVTVIDASLRTIGGVESGRFISEMKVRGTEVRQITYLIPAATQTASLVFTVERSRFDEYVDKIDAAAMKTEGAGAAAAPGQGFDWGQVALAGLLGAAIGGIIAGMKYLRSRRKA